MIPVAREEEEEPVDNNEDDEDGKALCPERKTTVPTGTENALPLLQHSVGSGPQQYLIPPAESSPEAQGNRFGAKILVSVLFE